MKKLRILIAEDNREMRWAIIRLLAGEFEVVGSTSDGRSLIDAALTSAPDVIVSDVYMPFLTGPEAMEVLRSAGMAIAFVFLSTETDGVAEYIEAGGLRFIPKPAMS